MASYQACGERALAVGARAAVVANHYAEGGAGALEAADAVWEMACGGDLPELRYLYDLDGSLTDKIGTIARRMYGADGVDVLPEAAEGLRHYEALGYGGLPVSRKYRVPPRAYTSARMSASRGSLACSGAM